MSKTKTPAEIAAEERYPDWYKDDFVRGAKNGFVSGYNAALQTLQWRKIDKDNYPRERVLCPPDRIGNFKKNREGILYHEDVDGSKNFNPTYYIILQDILNLPKEK